MARAHWLDHLVSFKTGPGRLFRDGFGDEAAVEALVAAPRWRLPRRPIDVVFGPTTHLRGLELAAGTFESPVPELPEGARRGHVLRLFPPDVSVDTPLYVVPAASGDEGFRLRRHLYAPLVREARIGLILLENPLYGARRPAGQSGPFVRTVQDHFAMTVGAVEEVRALLGWLEARGFRRLGVSGFSMGASIAAIAATCEARPLAAALFAVAASPIPVFLEGLLSRSIDFGALGVASGRPADDARARLSALLAPADLLRHPAPAAAAHAVLVAGSRDGYVFPAETRRLHDHWRGSELVTVDTGHPGLVLRHAGTLRAAARRAFRR